MAQPNLNTTHLLDDELWSRSLTHEIASELPGFSLQFFYGDLQGQTHVAVLQVRACNERPGSSDMVQFNLDMLGPTEPLLPQQTYRARHASLGDFAVMISPMAIHTDGIEYQANFSHAR